MTGARRVNLEPAFLLHHYPWRDTSRILELMTRTHGRVSVFSRASRRSGSTATGGALQPFTESLVSWSGRGEAGHLTSAERVRPPATLAGDRLMSGFYANELLLKLLPREDPHPRLFASYETALAELAAGSAQAPVLRRFELALLTELGYALPLIVRGATLLALADGRYVDGETAVEAKRLMREVLDHYLEQRGVESRRVVQDLQALDEQHEKEIDRRD